MRKSGEVQIGLEVLTEHPLVFRGGEGTNLPAPWDWIGRKLRNKIIHAVRVSAVGHFEWHILVELIEPELWDEKHKGALWR